MDELNKMREEKRKTEERLREMEEEHRKQQKLLEEQKQRVNEVRHWGYRGVF